MVKAFETNNFIVNFNVININSKLIFCGSKSVNLVFLFLYFELLRAINLLIFLKWKYKWLKIN